MARDSVRGFAAVSLSAMEFTKNQKLRSKLGPAPVYHIRRARSRSPWRLELAVDETNTASTGAGGI
jgi:hypothetical protein